ncbi:pentatricopeptide repeat-containing protein At5g48910-like [Hibiscus syriacus]|uniref:pentatricopeptide repeat-containing protein At5g48910-like n=1 Tax=Hibiscus syriacus TaxID=106335 RepID=UPI00192375E3|nr:pentatricopeptide repeat-containing protein At5g48910-like [Hibiscus syriacus]
MKNKGMRKEPGPGIKKINVMVSDMGNKLKEAEYRADTSAFLKNIDEEERETAFNYHSEKVAMAFGLISTAPGTPIRVVTNSEISEFVTIVTLQIS